MIAQVIAVCRKKGRKIGICGQAPSDYPEFAQFLVEQGIDSISLNPDTVLKTTMAILEERVMTEKSKQKKDERPIVCGTDFSAAAMEAVDIAAGMARRLETQTYPCACGCVSRHGRGRSGVI